MSAGRPKIVGGASPQEQASSPEQADTQTTGNVVPIIAASPGIWLDDRRRAHLALLLLTTGALVMAFIVYRPFLKVLFLALVLTLAVLPLHEQILRRVGGNTAAAVITTTTVLMLVMLPLLLMSLRLVSEAMNLYTSASQQGGAVWSSHSAWLNEGIQHAADRIGMQPSQLKAAITARVQEFGAWAVSMVGWAARGFLQQVSTGIITLLIMFFFLRDHKQYSHDILSMLPLPPGRVQELSSTLRNTITANIYGMVVVGAAQGGLMGLGWWMTGLPAPVLWGAIAAILSLVPLVGPSLVWWPGAIVLALQGKWIQAAVLVGWGAVVVSSVDYIVRPRFARGRANVNTLLVLLSLLGGIKAFGAIGIIAGPVVLSAVTVLLKIVREERAGTAAESAKTGEA
jgi:predicted PurR-regulated permease PerM